MFSGIRNTEGSLWKKQRQFVHRQMIGTENWGPGQAESQIFYEVSHLLNYFENKRSPVKDLSVLKHALSNVLFSITASKRFPYADSQFKRFLSVFDEQDRLMMNTGALCVIPMMRHFPRVKNTLMDFEKCLDEKDKFARAIIDDHKVTLDRKKPRDFVDSYLIMIEDIKATGNLEEMFEGVDPEKQLARVLLDLTTAESLTSKLHWLLLFMLHHPDIQTRVQAELDSVVEPNRRPELKDMVNLPYTRATIWEVMRRCTRGSSAYSTNR